MSKWLFIRNYVRVIILIMSVGWAMELVLLYTSEQNNTPSDARFLRGSFLYITSVFDDSPHNIERIWASKQKRLEADLGYPIAMYHISDFSSVTELAKSLDIEPIVALPSASEGIIYYSRLKDTDYIISLGPTQKQDREVSLDVLLIATYHLLIATVLFLWLAPLARDLQKLRDVASNFGADNFSARIKLSKNSSIALVADAFNNMAQRIQILVSAHKDLTHAVSHELKTPLARFKFSLELISERENGQKRDLYIQNMKQDVRELDELINEMLSYARLDVQNIRLNRQKVHADQWLAYFAHLYKGETKNISFKIENHTDQQPLYIDRHSMDRAVNNLIRNGLRHAHSELKVILHINTQEIKLAIHDDGPGIPQQYREKLFQPFIRMEDSRNKQSGGYGLGLAIAKKIIQQHGGSITIHTSFLGGAKFCIIWPVII